MTPIEFETLTQTAHGHHSIAFTDAVYAHVAKEPDYTAAIERTRRARGV